MKVITKTNLNLISSKERIENKFRSLGKFLERFEEKEELRLDLEINQEISRHNKGNVCCVDANLALPHVVLRIRKEAENVDLAISMVYKELKGQIEKYKTNRLSKIRKGAQSIRNFIFRR